MNYGHLSELEDNRLASNPDFPLVNSILVWLDGSDFEKLVFRLVAFMNNHPIHGSWSCRYMQTERCYDYNELERVLLEYVQGVNSKNIPEYDRRKPDDVIHVEKYLYGRIKNAPGRIAAIMYALWEGATRSTDLGEDGLRTLYPTTYEERIKQGDSELRTMQKSREEKKSLSPIDKMLWIGGGLALLFGLFQLSQTVRNVKEIAS